MPLSGLVTIVCGASGAIGSATVRALLAQDANVVLAALPDSALDRVAAEVTARGGREARTLVVGVDLTRRCDVDAMVAHTLARFGRIDVLIDVAGIGSSPALADCTDAELERVVLVNLLGAARAIHAVLPAMSAQGRGAIVNVGSIAGEAGVMGIYSGSKFGLRGLNDSLRREVRSLNIDVTLIEPGFVRSPMNPAMQGLPGPEVVADAIVSAILRPRRIRIVPALYWFPVLVATLFPGFTDLVFGN
ncbi:MAG: SDR family oxidoreductase, partial [Candidatus Eremiobacteraeota bacterium]|nr:SDR family oxidoreductase [Candidatus Eremiobacteraeota bacterium]